MGAELEGPYGGCRLTCPEPPSAWQMRAVAWGAHRLRLSHQPYQEGWSLVLVPLCPGVAL